MKFLVLGCNGMAGHMIALYLIGRGHDVLGYARRDRGLIPTVAGDARDTTMLAELIETHDFDVIINSVGVLNQFAEADVENAVWINAYLPHFLAKVAKERPTRIFQQSTDCVFSGQRGGYRVGDFPDGQSIYDRTKALGELCDEKNLTFRCSIVGPDMNPDGIGLMNWFLKSRGPIVGYARAVWTGVTTLELARAMEAAANENVTGLIHLVPEAPITKYDLLKLFNQYLRDEPIEMNPSETVSLNKSLIRDREDGFEYRVPGYVEMVRSVGEWIEAHADIYGHYIQKL